MINKQLTLFRGSGFHARFAILLFLLSSGFLGAQQASLPCPHCQVWNKPQAPFRIYGNTYYVGPHGLSSILITSDSGHVLIDGALPESVTQIVANIHLLGFRIEDVKLIVNSHVHFDHAGGIVELQDLTGARVLASEWSTAVMTKTDVGRGDPLPAPQIALAGARFHAQTVAGQRNPTGAVAAGTGGGSWGGHGERV